MDSGAVRGKSSPEAQFVLKLAAALLAAIVLVSWLAPNPVDNDPLPTTYNSGSAGIKAAYLTLADLGYKAERWDEGPGGLRGVDAANTTLVLTNPIVPETQASEVKNDVAGFLARGGRVLATGVNGAELLPGAGTKAPGEMFQKLCYTTPEGQGALARAGSVAMADTGAWSDTSPRSRVEQSCGRDAVVVRLKVGAGEAVWWSSPQPLTNRGLKDDASLKLVLASVGKPGRRILFDEHFHGAIPSIWDTTGGLPIRAIEIQASVVGALLVLSFGRRSGPLRTPMQVVRSSPLEFAESMGHLYGKAGATPVATEGARRRLRKFLEERCGIPAQVLRGAPDGVVEAVRLRLGGDWAELGEHLSGAGEAEHGTVSAKSALGLVRAMDEDLQRLSERLGKSGSGEGKKEPGE